jgi:uncharacterized glyoxalase superfamily protein PhnB
MKCLVSGWVLAGAVAVLAGPQALSQDPDFTSRMVEYRDGDAILKGYLAYDPSMEGRSPGVLVFHEWWGLNDYAKRRARQLAQLGYVSFYVYVKDADAAFKQAVAAGTKIMICLWYDGDAEDAARFYAKTFPNSSVGAVLRAPGDYPSGKEGNVLTVDFTVMGIPCLGLNGGPEFKHNG